MGEPNRRTFLRRGAVVGGTLVVGQAGALAQDQETLETVLSVPSLEFTFFVRMQNAFEQAIEEQDDLTGSFLDGQNSQPQQVSDLETAISNEVDFIMVSPITAEGIVPVVEQANEAGIPVVTIDRNTAEGEVATYVASENVQLGKRSSELLLEFMGDRADQDSYGVVELQGTPGASVTNDRTEGMREALDETDEFELLGSQTGEFQTAEALTVMEDFLTRFGDDIDGVYAQNDLMALGASRAASNAGREDLPITGIDGSEAWVETFADNEYHGTIAQLPEEMVFRSIEAGRSAVEGEELEEFIPIEGLRVTRENAQEYLDEFFGEGQETTTATPTATNTTTEDAG